MARQKYQIQNKMYKLEISQNLLNPAVQPFNKSYPKQSKETINEENKLRDCKQNDSKHMNGIRPYVTKERKNSKRQVRPALSSCQISKSKNKKLQTSSRKLEHISMISYQNNCVSNPSHISNSKQINQIYQQMMILKTEYKSLKSSYNVLVKQKQQVTFREQFQKQKYQHQKKLLLQQLVTQKKNHQILSSEIQRIKKQCFKILENQKFKYKKLEETLQEKQLMIAYLRKEIQNLKKDKEINPSQQNLEKIFFLQNSAPTFSYETYAKLSASNSIMSAMGNILIQDQTINNNVKSSKIINQPRENQFQDDSLSFSRQKELDSAQSLLTMNNDQTILTFTKKDAIILDDSSTSNQYENKEVLPTFKNRRSGGISFQNLKAKKSLNKSVSRGQSKKSKNSRLFTKRLEIMTDEFKDFNKKQEDTNSCQTKTKPSKSRMKNSKKPKSQALHDSMISQVLNGNFIKKQGQSSHIKSQNSKKK